MARLVAPRAVAGKPGNTSATTCFLLRVAARVPTTRILSREAREPIMDTTEIKEIVRTRNAEIATGTVGGIEARKPGA